MASQEHPLAVITGASRGLGATLAAFLAAQSYNLILTARGASALDATVQSLKNRYNGEIIAIDGDISSKTHRNKVLDAVESFGRLDLLVNNASDLGISPLPYLGDYPLEAVKQVFEVNVFAPLALVQETLPTLKKSHGLIVNISSDAAIGGYEGWGAYGSSKAALDLISLTLAGELEEDEVAVVAVDPGDMRTDMHQKAFHDEDISDRPLPDVTLPFWAWLLGQEHKAINGARYKAQADSWEVMS